ncbi:MAG TPA: YraN family protein [Aromatoleum sp.]|uniref:YraN family protein n=1 Tax=Aromatoleum sp. TaxID=2307007 RepID=UPI002B4A69E7|nr:YraN family protein [Aromatoleum sp.]HJV25122.1 YraN family protein [Aromatoleum sp.]
MREEKGNTRAGIVDPARGAKQARGKAAELLAERFLSSRGVTTIARNVRCRGGEVDLICFDRGVVVFVEVRLRTNPRFGGAAASITTTKRRRIELAARWWLYGAGRRYAERPCRFDAVLLKNLDVDDIDWIRGAFDAYCA